MRQRLERQDRNRIGIARFYLQSGFCLRYLFHHDQHRFEQIVYRIGKRALSCAAHGALAEGNRLEESLVTGLWHWDRKTEEGIEDSPLYLSRIWTER